MTTRMLLERAANLDGFAKAKAAGRTSLFVPIPLAHLYIKLDFKLQYENAANAEDARGFFRSVARAAMAAHGVAEMFQGAVLEVQGSMLHVALPRSDTTDARAYAAALHWAFRSIFNDPNSRVEGWRMTVDAGKTLVVAGRGVHGDDSWVSLGTSANRPAKHLHAQLEEPEALRRLRRFHLGVHSRTTNSWIYEDLDRVPQRLVESKSLADSIRRAEPDIDFGFGAMELRGAKAQAAPIGPAGTPASPSPDRPQAHFGWVMRTDLDGFTDRVEECFDNDPELQELAAGFYRIMDTAASFTARHKESLVQLPWAGDNFTAAAVFANKSEYDRAIPKRLVELSLDFDKEMADQAVDSGFGGWAHGVAGGDVHGNAAGNVFVAGIEAGGRRFLVGAGEGFGRSAQAFGDINPKAKQMVVYEPDWSKLDSVYKPAFEPAVTRRGQQSTLYRTAATEGLVRARARMAAAGTTTAVTFATAAPRQVATSPYFP